MTDQSLKSQVQSDMKTAMKAKDKERLGTIRMLLAAIKQREIDDQISLTDTDVLAVINKMIKQRKESEKQYRDADRPELAEKEALEITHLTIYLPEQLEAEKVNEIVDAAVTETGATSMKDMGAVMNIVRPQVQGRADMGAISALIKQKLS